MDTKDKDNSNFPVAGKDANQQSMKNYDAGENGGGDEDIDEVPLFRRKRVIIPILAVLTALAIVGYYWYMNMQDYVFDRRRLCRCQQRGDQLEDAWKDRLSWYR